MSKMLLVIVLIIGMMSVAGCGDSSQEITNNGKLEDIGFEPTFGENAEFDLAYMDNSGETLPVVIDGISVQNYGGYAEYRYDISNQTEDDIKEGSIIVLAWDENQLPIKLGGLYQGTEHQYTIGGTFENLASKSSDTIYFQLVNTDIKYMVAVLYEYEDFNGNKWTNPLQAYMEEVCAGKKLTDTEMYYFEFNTADVQTFNGAIGSYEPLHVDESINGRIDFNEVDDTTIGFNLYIFELGYSVLSGTAQITSSNSARYEEDGFAINFTWNDDGTLLVSNEGSSMSREAGTIEWITEDVYYKWSSEFN